MQLHNTIKRGLDFIISFIMLILLFPLFCLLGAAVKLDSRGPVFYRQVRLGKHGKPFRMIKFRSMIVNAENMGSGLFNYKDDKRVTRVGRFLRNTSLDELPQLINVLKGEMSLVGPRPPVVYELGDYKTLNRRYKKRFEVLPGITGLAQINGRNEILWDEKVNLDNRYIDLFRKKGCLVDLIILLGTLGKVLHKSNIYEEKPDKEITDEKAAKLAQAEVIAMAHAKEE